MALKLTRAARPFVPEWNGNVSLPQSDQVRLKYRTLTVEDVFRAHEEVDIDMLDPGAIAKQDMKTQKQHWRFLRHILINYTQEWEGVEIDGEKRTTGQEVVDAAGMNLMDLFGEITTKIINDSLGTEVEAKNSGGQSAPESLGSGTTAVSVLPTNSKPLETAVVGT